MLNTEYPAAAGNSRSRRVKQAIWLYLILLIFEGTLRKWFLPGLATPLLLIRDPIVAYILFEAARQRLLPKSPLILVSMLIAVIAMFLAVTLGHGNQFVAAYGARPLLLHFPAMFVMAQVLDRDEILRIGRFVLVVSMPMTVLIALQFYSPQTAWVNRGVGGEGGAGFSGALGYFRPPGTFSFTNGVALFYSLQAVFLIYFWLAKQAIVKPWLRWMATLCLIAALPLALSRGLIFQVVLTVLFAGICMGAKMRLMMRGIMVASAVILAALLFSGMDFFQTALKVIATRFDNAAQAEGGLEGTLVDRYLGGLWAALADAGEQPTFGYGIGMGTNVGSMLLTGKTQFLISEGEWGRQVGELGPFLGLLVIGMRLWISLAAAIRSWAKLLRGDPLPWMLLSFASQVLPQGVWAQPTSLGFSILMGALLLGSLKRSHPPPAVQSTFPRVTRTG